MSYGEFLYHYDTIVYITDTIGGVSYQGSGVLLSPDEVLTASHVVYSSQYGVASDVVVTPGYSIGLSPYGSTDGVSVQYNVIQDANGTISLAESQSDFALIRLAQPFTAAGNMGIESNYAGSGANVSGYPAIDGGAQITVPEIITQNPYATLYDGFALGAGSSGGPVWIYGTNGDPYVVGLVSSANTMTGTGYFTQITTTTFNTIESWMQQDAAACFASGTRIATLRGDIPVEHLTTDDMVLTKFRNQAPIVWIGHRHLACRRPPDPARVWPIRVMRDAFGRGRPRRDLLLSPDHSVFVGGMLVPIRYLVNGATIAQEPADHITYWHVELPRHDILFAEGLPAESYLDTGNRADFDNGGQSLVLFPDFGERTWQTEACAPLLREGKRLTAIRRRLHARALTLGHALTRQPDLKVLAGAKELIAAIDGRRWHVHLPACIGSVRLLSRTWVPWHSHPAKTDTRGLGIAVARLWLDGREMSLDSANLHRGWHASEAAWRWTDGEAHIPVGDARSLAFELAMTGSYWYSESKSASQRRAA